MKTNKIIILLAAAAIALAGCNSQKKLAKSNTTEETHKTVVIKKKSVQQRAIEAQPDFASVYADKVKFAVTYQQKNVSANGNISLIKDSICIISVQPLFGIELVRLEVTPQEVTLVDKLNKRYVQMTYPEIEQQVGLPITFEDVQNILMARMVVLGKPQSHLYSNAAKATSSNGQTEVKLTEGKVNYAYTIDENSLNLLKTVVSRSSYKGEAVIDYKSHKLYGDILFPSGVAVSYEGGSISASGTLSFSNLIFNTPVSAQRISLRNYRKTDISTILK